jgi:hypothetical protein
MSQLIKRNFDALRVLKKASPKLRKAILTNSEKELILALCEIITNVLSGTVKLSSKQKKHLNTHKKSLRRVVDKRVGIKEKRHLLQKGGFLTTLLPPALTLLASLINHAID